ncbi:MAG: phosphoribosylamine--glycine ligase [Gammaproteobacteria bacterium]|nr:phosphoribosylamine--glycine ligase [Gammaproteobacteria bacterium]
MKVMITGSGGREHALAWRVARSEGVEKVYVLPGNAGTARDVGIENIAIDVMNFDAQIQFALDHAVDLTIIGPEAPLVAGVVDRFQAAGLKVLGPDSHSAQLEGSKKFTKDFLKRHGIPTAAYESFTDSEAAKSFVGKTGVPIVIKADGLAAGKGVVIAYSLEEAESTIDQMLSGNAFGEAGSRIVIEEFLEGEEASFIVIADGVNVVPFASSQDHKAIHDGDKGSNTGGMGAYSPAPVVTPEMHQRIMDQVILPTIKGMSDEGMPYTGFLYAGLMITNDGVPKVIEFNCRFGDPETQPVMFRLQSDLVALCQAALEGRLAGYSITFDPRPAVTVVMAAGGYPEQYRKGDAISGLEGLDTETGKVFHAGTDLRDGSVITNGGRVLGVTSLGDSVKDAQSRAYEMVKSISWQDAYYRTDIGYRAIDRESAQG